MELLDTAVVTLIMGAAVLYLYKVFKPKKKGNSSPGCGCSATDCKVSKLKIKPPKDTAIDKS